MATSAKWRLADFFRSNGAWLVAWMVILIVIFLVVHLWPQGPSPAPASIKRQVTFSILYPQGYTIDAQSWKYLPNEHAVQFEARESGYAVTFSEEETPLAYRDDVAAYNRFIGSLKPRANFNVPLGTVSITNFVTAGDYQVVGDTGVLNAKGTLLLAHPNIQLTDDQWRAMFEALEVD